jgi:hypothetical protein
MIEDVQLVCQKWRVSDSDGINIFLNLIGCMSQQGKTSDAFFVWSLLCECTIGEENWKMDCAASGVNCGCA